MSDPISKKAIPSGGSWADEVKNPDKKETAKEQADSDSSGVRKKGR